MDMNPAERAAYLDGLLDMMIEYLGENDLVRRVVADYRADPTPQHADRLLEVAGEHTRSVAARRTTGV